MNKDYTFQFWSVAAKAAKNSPWLVAVILLGVSILIVGYLEGQTAASKILTVSKESWLSIAGSLVASAAFLFIHNVLTLLQQAKTQVPMDYYEVIHNGFGIKWIYSQRGGSDIQELYRKLISNAKERVWAIGMTNNSFLAQHEDLVLSKCKTLSGFEMRLVFWNPATKLVVNGVDSYCIFDVQNKLEEKIDSEINWGLKIDKRIDLVNKKIADAKISPGVAKVYKLSLVTNASCFIIDDDIFYFPFLSRSNSNLDPHIRLSAKNGLGKLIFEHYSYILSNNNFCHECVEIS